METSIRDRVRARLKAAKFENWTLVAHQMAGRNAVAAVVLMHLVDVLHERGGKLTIKISNDEWRRLYDFGRTRLRHAGEALVPAGVTYLNHFINSWKIDEYAFWKAFEEALELCKPDLSDSDTSAQNEQDDPVQNGHDDAGDEGEDGADGVRNEPLILREREKGYLEIFSAFRLRFGGDLQRLLDRLIGAAARLGESVTRAVVGRCMNAGGRTWHYVAAALENESQRSAHGQQLALMPAVDVSRSARPKKDLRTVKNDAPAMAWTWTPGGETDASKNDLQPVESPATAPVHAVAASPESAAWDTAYHQLRLQLGAEKFELWLRDARFLRFEAEHFVIGVHNTATRDMLQHRLYRNVARLLSDAWGKPAAIRFESRDTTPPSVDVLPFFTVQTGAAS